MTRHHIGLVYCAAVWGATFYVVKDALAAVDPVTMVAYRFLIAAALLLPWVWRRLRGTLALRHGAVLGAFLGTSYLTQTVGLKYTTAANSGFITGLFVVFVPLILWGTGARAKERAPSGLTSSAGAREERAGAEQRRREDGGLADERSDQFNTVRRPPTVKQWGAVAVAVAGLWLLTGGLREFTIGDGLTVVTAVAYAAQVVAVDRVAHGADPLVLAFHQFWVVGLGSLAISLIGGYPLGIATMSGAWVVLFLALVPTLSAFVLQLVGQRHVAPFTATLIFLLEPVFAAAFAWTLGGESMTMARLAGGALIVSAMFLGELAARRPAEAMVPAAK